MNVIITKFNINKILKSIYISDIGIEGEIYKINFRWFNKLEVSFLLLFKQLFENPDEFFKKYEIQKKENNEHFIFDNNTPSYHKNASCLRLKSNFKNIKIPDKILSKGTEFVQKFRLWCKENYNFEYETDLKTFALKVKEEFNINENLEFVDYSNSGVLSFENLSLNDIESEIDNLIEKANIYYTSTQSIKSILNKFGKRSFLHKNISKIPEIETTGSKEEVEQVLKYFQNHFKTPLTTLLKEYYRIKYNPQLKFVNTVLDQIGYVPCKSCFTKLEIINLENRSKISNLYKEVLSACSMKECDIALSLCNEILKIDSLNELALGKKIRCFNRTDYNEIIKESNFYISNFDVEPATYFAITKAYFFVNNYKKTIEFGNKATEANFPYLNFMLGRSYLKEKMYGMALKYLFAYGRVKPIETFQENHFLAYYFKGKKNFAAAKFCYTNALHAYEKLDKKNISVIEKLKNEIETLSSL